MAIYDIETIEGTVTVYPYRTAMVRDVIVELPRHEVAEFECMLAAAAGVRVDNHTVYGISRGGKVLYVMFSDFMARLGFSIDESRW